MEIVSLALRNLARRRLRTTLTVTGVALAIAFTVGLLSISEGFIVATDQSLARQGEHIVVLPEEVAGHPTPMLEAFGTTLPQEVVDEVHKVDNVKAVYPVLTQTWLPGRDFASWTALNGVTPPFLADLRPYLKLKKGRLLQEGDQYVIVVGAMVAKRQKLDLGSWLTVRGRELEVVGILEHSGGMFGFEDLTAYLPLSTLQELYRLPGEITSALVTVKDVAQSEATASKINAALPEVKAQTAEEVLGMARDWIGIARTMHFSVASIALLIGILFVLSTMFMAVSERVREIGTMRALGTPRRLVFRLILSESILIGLGAGLLGLGGGYLLSQLITYGVGKALGVAWLQTAVTPRLLALGLATALLVGALGGLYPAWRIARTNIVEALRYE